MMIKANELRIGNWVEDRFDIRKIIHRQIDDEDISLICRQGHGQWVIPIPLTPDVLKKCGFVSTDKSKAIFMYNDLILKSMGDHKSWSPRQRIVHEGNPRRDESIIGIRCVPLLFLHQLQNLYFALTGEELNYQP